MPEPLASLTDALSEMLGRFDAHLRGGGYAAEPIRMYLAGGMAMNYHCGARYTEDVDASFSHRVLVPASELAVDYVREDGSASTLYFDTNYNDTFALLHPDYREDAVEWGGIGNDARLIQLYVLNSVDLAVSKVSRFSEQDRADILLLAQRKLIGAAELRKRATEALDYYVGDARWIRLNLEELEQEIAAL